MKREVIFVLMFILLLASVIFIYASEEQQVEKAYTCLETRINQTKCSSMNFEERVFSFLADGQCAVELSADNLSGQCWPKSGCRVKSTAQAILALHKKVNTTKAENWLLSQTAIPTGIDWFLEIEILDAGVASCDITYSGSKYTVLIGEDKKINKNAGTYLTLAQGNYWLKIDPKLYNNEIKISCDKKFLTTLLFRKQGSSTIQVSESVHNAGATGETTETVKSLCFAQNNICNYEGSLWAALVLSSLDYDDRVSDFMPYLITMKDESLNEIYIPEAFLYYLTGKFRTELLIKQRSDSYWEESGDRYYDTALALLPFSYEDPYEKDNSIDWLLSVQQQNGCWNNGNIRDTAFILYSIWPRGTSLPPGHCEYDSDCPAVSCKEKWCDNGECMYEDVDCGIDNDGCCPDGCDSYYDNDCESVICNRDDDCSKDYSDLYCMDDETVYQDIYTYSCNLNTHTCVISDTEEKKIEKCSSSEVCEYGECVEDGGGGGVECSWLKPCPNGYDCINNECVPDGSSVECTSDDQCQSDSYSDLYCMDDESVYQDHYLYWCDTSEGTCELDYEEQLVETCDSTEECDGGVCRTGRSCGWFNPCDDGYECIDNWCVPEGGCEYDEDCTEEDCKEATCVSGTCLYEYIGCIDNDGCCNPGCDYSNDDDCGPGPECTSDSDCLHYNYNTSEYCKSDNNIYLDVYTYTCENEYCEDTLTEQLVEECSNTEECYAAACYSTGNYECYTDNDCDYPYEICNEYGECVEYVECEDFSDCDYYEDCINNVCVPYACETDYDCGEGGVCSDEGYCEYPELSDCEQEGYWCSSQAGCYNTGGLVLEEYSCTNDLFICCDTEPVLLTCLQEYGEICSSDEQCLYGATIEVSDTNAGEVCCIGDGAYCDEVGGAGDYYCEDYDGICRYDYCEDDEEEKSYTCDYEGEICCIKKDVPKPKRGWILIVLLLILIILAVLGIVFRDKVRTEWIKIKDKFSGKKEKKKPITPLLSQHPHPASQRRILPRRILHPSQTAQQHPMKRPLPFRPGQRPYPYRPPQPSQTPKTSGKPSFITNLLSLAHPSAHKEPTQQKIPAQPEKTPEKKPEEKPKEKPKNPELEDVLKKLKEMGGKE